MSQADNVRQILQPDASAIRKHLEFLFSDMSDFCDGKIQISTLTLAENFSLDEIDKAVAQAIKWNQSGKSVYVLCGLMNPEIQDSTRAGQDDFYGTSILWCDIDEPVDPEGLKFLYTHCKPNAVTVTSRMPERRIQLLWKLQDTATDTDAIRESLGGVCQLLGGDPKVTHQTSLMRLSGTVNFPNNDKRAKGRIDENTEFHIVNNEKVSLDRFMLSYPMTGYVDEFEMHHESQVPVTVTSAEGLGLSSVIIDGREEYMSRMVFASILTLPKKLMRWPSPQEVFDDVWPVYSGKVSGRNGRTLDQDHRGTKAVQQKIKSKLRQITVGRVRKAPALDVIVAEGKAEQAAERLRMTQNTQADPVTGEIKPKITATSIANIDLDVIPPREFLYHNIVARKYVTMIVAAPGAGKSILTLGIAASAASGKAWGKWSTPQDAPVNVWVYNNEEGFDELRRRIKGVMMEMGLSKEDFGSKLFIDSGEHKSITVAKLDDKGSVIYTPDYESLKAEILARGIDMLVIDPFAETYDVKENDNDQIKQVTRLYRNIAIECNCGVVLVHHARKGMNNEGAAGNMDMARGGGAQMGVVRRAFTLAPMDEDEAKKLGVPKDQKKWFARLDDAKSNITAPADSITWLKLKSVFINNGNGLFPSGDSVGVFTHISAEEIAEEHGGAQLEEGRLVLQIIADWMVYHDQMRTASFPNAVTELIRSGKLNYKQRKMYDALNFAISNAADIGPIVSEGYSCTFSISETLAKNNTKIILMNATKIND